MPDTVRFADAPISVPLPPKQAPSDSATHSGRMAASPPNCGAMACNTGIIAATKGMLSMIADRIAALHSTMLAVRPRLPDVPARISCASQASAPVTSTPRTTMNRPTKKKMVIQSTSA